LRSDADAVEFEGALSEFSVGGVGQQAGEVRAAAAKASGQAHDLLGRPVGKDAHGIVIESDGSKRVR